MEFRFEEVPSREISITENSEPTLTYCYGESVTQPYYHPIYAPNGQVVTKGAEDKHLPGLCFSIGSTKGDSETRLKLQRKATNLEWETLKEYVQFVNITKFQANSHEIINTCKTRVLPRQNNVQIIDINIDLQALSNSTTFDNIGLGYYAAEMEHRKAANSDGRIGEMEVNEKESAWGTLCGIVGNTAVGLAIIPHPENGQTHFLAEDAYLGFLFAQSQPFSLDINTNQTLKYRVIVYAGDLFTVDISDYYHKYTNCMSEIQ